ncbi:MAG TPA: rhodanese-like domain-containing protein, partial [Acidobacteriaceae bacterium]
AQYSYVVSSEGEAVVIDPMRDFDRYTEYAAEEGLAIKYVTETHIHADFVSGALALSKATGAELALSSYDQEPYLYSMEHHQLRDGDVLHIGQLRLAALHTPGHTPEHLSFVLFDEERDASQPLALFSGDFLFVGSLGRPDLLGEKAKQELAHELYRSLHVRIASLPDGVHLYPGHGAGSLCGAGMGERPESTLGYERLSQPLFKLEEEAFVREILASVPPMPSYYPRMKELNSRGASSVANLPGKAPLTPARIAALLADEKVTLIDLRRPEAFGGAHIPGAVNIGAGQNLSLWAGWMLDPNQRLILVDDKGDDEDSRRSLARVGLEQMEGFLQKGMPAWVDAGMEFTRTPQLSTKEVAGRSHDARVLDVRSQKEWTGGHIQDAVHIPLGELAERMKELKKDSEIITVCGSGYRSSIAASLLQANGFTRISSMDGGMTAWNERKLPRSMS